MSLPAKKGKRFAAFFIIKITVSNAGTTQPFGACGHNSFTQFMFATAWANLATSSCENVVEYNGIRATASTLAKQQRYRHNAPPGKR